MQYFITLCRAYCNDSEEIIKPKSFFDDAIISLRMDKPLDQLDDNVDVDVSKLSSGLKQMKM